MQVGCTYSLFFPDTPMCDEPVTGAVVTEDSADDYRLVVNWHCAGHAPEIMHELIACGYTSDDMATVVLSTVERPVVGNPTDSQNDTIHMGDRVAVAPHLDRWMQGDRYGVVIGWHRESVTVKLIRSGDVVVLTDKNLTLVER